VNLGREFSEKFCLDGGEREQGIAKFGQPSGSNSVWLHSFECKTRANNGKYWWHIL